MRAPRGMICARCCQQEAYPYVPSFAHSSSIVDEIDKLPDIKTRWRAITSPTVHRVGYALIISVEAVTAALCLAGARKQLDDGVAGKQMSLAGLSAGFALFFIGFVCFGAESVLQPTKLCDSVLVKSVILGETT